MSQIPFNQPADGHLDINFFDRAVPHYISEFFRVSILFEDSLPFEACCTVRAPNDIVTVVIIMKKEYENDFRAWLAGDSTTISSCCKRRELYCHEVCHLVAAMRAYPGSRSSTEREDFIGKVKAKFAKSLNNAANLTAVPLVSVEGNGGSPSIFDEDHFRYADDGLDYFGLYRELMLDHARMLDCAEKLCAHGNWEFTIVDVTKETFVSHQFLHIFQDKLAELIDVLDEKLKIAQAS